MGVNHWLLCLTLVLVNAASDVQYFGMVYRSPQNGLTRVTLDPPKTSEDFWAFGEDSIFEFSAVSRFSMFSGVVSLSDEVFYWISDNQYWYASVNRLSIRNGTLLPSVYANIATDPYNIYKISPMSPLMMVYENHKLISLLSPPNGIGKTLMVFSMDFSKTLPSYTTTWINFTNEDPQDMVATYSNGKFVLAWSGDPYTDLTSFYSIDATTGKLTTLAHWMNSSGSALAFTISGDQLVGFSSHFENTNNNQMYAFQVDLATKTCDTQEMSLLPRDFFPTNFVFHDTSVAYFMNVDLHILYKWDFAAAKLSSTTFDGQPVDSIVMGYN